MTDKDFTASNGWTVSPPDLEGDLNLHNSEGLLADYVSKDSVGPLREYFQAERDKELGRWRDPENPDMVVLLHDRGLRVLNERDGHWESWTRKQAKHDWNVEVFGYDTACRYFQEHPEPKPWDMAEEDEIWVLTIDGGVEAWRLNEYGTWTNTSANVCLANPPITAGHRIWPEGEASE